MGLFNSFKESLLKGNYNLSANLDQTEGLGNTYFEFVESSPDLFGNSTRSDLSSIISGTNNNGINATPKLFKSLVDDSDNAITDSDVSIEKSSSSSVVFLRLNSSKNFKLKYSSSLDFGGKSAVGLILLNDKSGDAASQGSGGSVTQASDDQLIAYFALSSSLSASGATQVEIPTPSDLIEIN